MNAALLMLVQVQLYPFSTPGVGQRIASKPVKELWASLAGKRETCREVHFGLASSRLMDEVQIRGSHSASHP